jgi:hypothetical protein
MICHFPPQVNLMQALIVCLLAENNYLSASFSFPYASKHNIDFFGK